MNQTVTTTASVTLEARLKATLKARASVFRTAMWPSANILLACGLQGLIMILALTRAAWIPSN